MSLGEVELKPPPVMRISVHYEGGKHDVYVEESIMTLGHTLGTMMQVVMEKLPAASDEEEKKKRARSVLYRWDPASKTRGDQLIATSEFAENSQEQYKDLWLQEFWTIRVMGSTDPHGTIRVPVDTKIVDLRERFKLKNHEAFYTWSDIGDVKLENVDTLKDKSEDGGVLFITDTRTKVTVHHDDKGTHKTFVIYVKPGETVRDVWAQLPHNDPVEYKTLYLVDDAAKEFIQLMS